MSITLTFRMRHRDGVYRTVEAHAAPLHDAQGRLQEWFGTTTDVTPEHEAQAAIEARSLRLTVAMQAAKIHIVSLDLTAWTLEFETGGERKEHETITYDAALLRVHPDDKPTLDCYLRRLASGEDPGGLFEFRVQNLRDEQWMQSSALLQRGSDGRPLRVIGCLIDITERKSMELMLREAGRRKNEFLAMLAHELRNPLAPLRTVIVLLQKDNESQTNTHELISLMSRQVEHMTRIVDDLLEMSRITQGRIALQLEPILVGTAVYHALEAIAGMVEARAAYRRRRHRRHDLGQRRRHASVVDPRQRAQQREQVHARAWPHHGERAYRRAIGVDRHRRYRHRHFRRSAAEGVRTVLAGRTHARPFERRPRHRAFAGEKTGRDAQGHDRRAKPGTGTRHDRDHPAAAPASSQTAFGARAVDTTVHETRQALRILVVDDNRDAADSLAMLCESEGHVARVAYSSMEAIDAAAQLGPDVALLDIDLPDIDGYELARRLHRKGESTPLLIAVTGYGQAEDRLRAQAAGFDYHFVKPVNVDILLKLFASLTVSR